LELIAVDPVAGTIEVAFRATDRFLNPAGHVQGGFLAAMLDDTLGPALVATLADGEWAPTINLNVQFVRPAKPGRLTGRGRVVRRGLDVALLAGELWDGDEVVATATASAVIRWSSWSRAQIHPQIHPRVDDRVPRAAYRARRRCTRFSPP
jgi:uncharacterized protein (TIGR00369 family)